MGRWQDYFEDLTQMNIPNQEWMESIREEDVKEALKLLKCGKAAGQNYIIPETNQGKMQKL